jgi:hypothetical protein
MKEFLLKRRHKTGDKDKDSKIIITITIIILGLLKIFVFSEENQWEGLTHKNENSYEEKDAK